MNKPINEIVKQKLLKSYKHRVPDLIKSSNPGFDLASRFFNEDSHRDIYLYLAYVLTSENTLALDSVLDYDSGFKYMLIALALGFGKDSPQYKFLRNSSIAEDVAQITKVSNEGNIVSKREDLLSSLNK